MCHDQRPRLICKPKRTVIYWSGYHAWEEPPYSALSCRISCREEAQVKSCRQQTYLHSLPVIRHFHAFVRPREAYANTCQVKMKPPIPNLQHVTPSVAVRSNSASDGQVADLRQDLLNTIVEVTSCILFSCIRIEVLLYLCHPRVGLCTEP